LGKFLGKTCAPYIFGEIKQHALRQNSYPGFPFNSLGKFAAFSKKFPGGVLNFFPPFLGL